MCIKTIKYIILNLYKIAKYIIYYKYKKKKFIRYVTFYEFWLKQLF